MTSIDDVFGGKLTSAARCVDDGKADFPDLGLREANGRFKAAVQQAVVFGRLSQTCNSILSPSGGVRYQSNLPLCIEHGMGV
jgi:hypothetical protein